MDVEWMMFLTQINAFIKTKCTTNKFLHQGHVKCYHSLLVNDYYSWAQLTSNPLLLPVTSSSANY